MDESGAGSPDDRDDGAYSRARPYVTGRLPVADARVADGAGTGLPDNPVPAAGEASRPGLLVPARPPEHRTVPLPAAGQATRRRRGGMARLRQPLAARARRRPAATTGRGPAVIGAVAGMVAITGGVLLLLPRHPGPLATGKCRQGGCGRAVVPAPGTVVPATVPGAVVPATVPLLTSPQPAARPSAGQPATAQATGRPPAAATATATMTASPSATGTAPGGRGGTVTVATPGSQVGTVGTAASLQVQATDTASGQTLAYSASGLPAGLSISSATGLVSGTPATAGTSTVTVTATDRTGASGSATFTWTISSSGGGGSGACTVTYTTTSQWTGGFVASVTITAGPSAIDGWTLKFRFPGDQQVTNAWNGVESQSGENVTITSESYNAGIPAGGSTSLGFQGTWNTSDAAPTSFTVNSTPCG
jgi:hypothetical protein